MLCDFSHDGKCTQCGHVASTPSLIRHCRPARIRQSRPAYVPPPTLADLHMMQTAIRLDPSALCLPGTALTALLSRIGITYTPDCPCRSRAAIMDAWGCDECERRIDEIVGWLREEADKRGLPFLDAAGRMLVRRAIKNARKQAGEPKATEPH